MYNQYKDAAEFFVVYIKEAHPSDGWVMPSNVEAGISVKDPRTLMERATVAETACSTLKINIPCLVDQLDDKVNTTYSAWPDRMYCIDSDGRIAVKGGQGPFGFEPSLDQTETWLKSLCIAKTQ